MTASEEEPPSEIELNKKAARAQLILYIIMFLGMIAPFILAWWVGAFRF